ncbi:imelysin family protein [Polaribacter porphyrae]|uniref:Peptidase M75 superfamily protein n=1 Tax=Polaribacter porphyrae TaxID=1137780 RepID=A0A2S7WKX4_9FLAO|nr:imelysin family protein [Polaribacter porphyrae]PQJ78258.1 peptidase M75 superfamily protein [Polaribacter porphyrae]
MLKKIGILFIISIVIIACNSTDEGETGIIDNFNRGAMLTHIADNIINPSYESFKNQMVALKLAGDTFATTPNQTNLETLRTFYVNAYIDWQNIEMFNIGKAEELNYSFFMNIYPLSSVDLESNISSGTYNLDNDNYHDEQGFPALDYLLYGVANSDTEILSKYTTDTNATNYKKYLLDVLNQMNSLTEQVVTGWSSFRSEFIASTSNTATSSLNKFLNDYIEYYERKLRANKFGIPAGVFSSTTLPEKVEAFYKKDISKELALESLNAFISLFQGKYKGNVTATGLSFEQYLEALDRKDLATAITSQLFAAKAEIQTLNNNFNQQIIDDNSKMTRAYDELQKAVVLLKVDMASALDIQIVFIDADGD